MYQLNPLYEFSKIAVSRMTGLRKLMHPITSSNIDAMREEMYQILRKKKTWFGVGDINNIGRWVTRQQLQKIIIDCLPEIRRNPNSFRQIILKRISML